MEARQPRLAGDALQGQRLGVGVGDELTGPDQTAQDDRRGLHARILPHGSAGGEADCAATRRAPSAGRHDTWWYTARYYYRSGSLRV